LNYGIFLVEKRVEKANQDFFTFLGTKNFLKGKINFWIDKFWIDKSHFSLACVMGASTIGA
jgi:hypothetical protein